jgi:katanin p80 WD40 repeat-containing subunit B1
VDCVRFSINEEQVCAGSATGALKIWDLESAKILRTLTGHKSGITCVDFHPYGDFLASGSSDSGIKVRTWMNNGLICLKCMNNRFDNY